MTYHCPSCLNPLKERDTDETGLCNSCLFKVAQTKKIRELENILEDKGSYIRHLENIICAQELGFSMTPNEAELCLEIVEDFKMNAEQEHQDEEDARLEGHDPEPTEGEKAWFVIDCNYPGVFYRLPLKLEEIALAIEWMQCNGAQPTEPYEDVFYPTKVDEDGEWVIRDAYVPVGENLDWVNKRMGRK